MTQGAYTPQGINLPYNASTALPGPYLLPAYEIAVQVVETNKVATMPVRGAGYPEGASRWSACSMRSRSKLDLDRAEVRRRNLIPAEQDSLHDAAQDPLRLVDHHRQRRLPAMSAACARRHRLRELSRTPGQGARRGPLSRHRHRQRRQGHRPRPVRIRHRARRPLRPHFGLHRRDADGAGHPHGAGADLRRAIQCRTRKTSP